MIFERDMTYRHVCSLDLSIRVNLNMGPYSNGDISLVVRYWNRHSKFFQGDADVVTIKLVDFWKWSEEDK